MIITEFYETRDDGVNLYRTYSNTDMRIRQDQTGVVYDDAIDVENSGYTYTETDIPIEEDTADDDASEAEAEEILNILLGETP